MAHGTVAPDLLHWCGNHVGAGRCGPVMLCAWCDEEATVYLVSDADSHANADAACDEHDAMWGRLYRRSVPLRRHVEVDLRSSQRVDLTGAASRSTVA